MLKIVPQKRHQVRLEQKRHVLEGKSGRRTTATRRGANVVEQFGLAGPARGVWRKQQRPVEDGGKTERAANVGEAIIHALWIKAGNGGDQRGWPLRSCEQLIQSRQRKPVACDLARAPRLLGAPGYGVDAVRRIATQRVEVALGAAAAAGILHYDPVAVARVPTGMG